MQDIGIVAHDAGGAEILSSWLRRQSSVPRCVLEGPAVEIFRTKLNSAYKTLSYREFERALADMDFILTGTSYASDLEKKVVRLANGRVPTAVFLDHWCHYPERFQLDGKTTLPDEIWVGDEDAFRLAAQCFPKKILKLVPNPYFEDIKAQIQKAPRPVKPTGEGIRILYVTEPASAYGLKQHGDERFLGYTEFDALKNYLQSLASCKTPLGAIRIRQHPSEPKNKYAGLLREFPYLPIQMAGNESLIDDCLWAEWVVGCQTMALVTALLAQRKVFSCIPKGGKPCVLPQREIIHLFNS